MRPRWWWSVPSRLWDRLKASATDTENSRIQHFGDIWPNDVIFGARFLDLPVFTCDHLQSQSSVFSCLALHCSKCQSSSAVIRLSGSRASARKLLEIEPKKNGCMLHAGSNSKIWWFLLVRCVRAFSPANPRSASLAAQKESGNRKQRTAQNYENMWKEYRFSLKYPKAARSGTQNSRCPMSWDQHVFFTHCWS